MVLLAGLFGLAAAALGLTDSGGASIAFFLVVEAALPNWVTLAVVVLAVLLVVSSADTTFNAIASVVTADLSRLLVQPTQETLYTGERVLTGVVGIGVTFIGARGYSVLELFLTTDLLAAAVFVPFLAGLYSERLSGAGAVGSSLAGLVVGVAYFPLLRAPMASVPVIGGLLPAPGFLPAFVGATAVSTGGTILAIALWDDDVDLSAVNRNSRRLDEPVGDGEETR
jgi:Na+/proline symporter